MKKSNRIMRKYMNPIIILTFLFPIISLIVLSGILGLTESILVLWLTYMVFALIFGRAYCGYICQFGMFQRFFNLVGEILFKKPFAIPSGLDWFMRKFKYVFLAVLIVWGVIKMKFLISDFPFNQYSVFWDSLGIFEGMLDITVAIFIFTAIIGSILYRSFYCKYLCIKGSVFGVVSKISLTRMKIDKSKCTGCRLCTANCPMNLQVHTCDTIKSMECLHCYQCVSVCPQKAIKNSFKGNPVSSAVLVMLSMVAYIFLLSSLVNLLT